MMNKSTIINLSNALLFQCCWFSAVMLEIQCALIFIVITLVIYFYSLKIINKKIIFFSIVLIVFSITGYIGDSIVAWQVGLVYSGSSELLAPTWLFILWLAFLTTLLFSMKWIFINFWITFLIGMCIVPFSYFAGIHLSNSYLSEERFITYFFIEGTWWSIILLSYRKVNEIYEVRYENNI